jgi:hypothetical protein
MGGGAIETEGYKFLLDATQFAGIRRRNRIPDNGGVFELP